MRVKLMDWDDGISKQRLRFWCEGCRSSHAIPVDGTRGWQWNGDTEKPTITPSILTTTGNYEHAPDVCHLFITDGMIDFLSDCTHALAGQKIDLPNLEEIEQDW